MASESTNGLRRKGDDSVLDRQGYRRSRFNTTFFGGIQAQKVVNAVLAEEARKRQELFETINPSTALVQGMVPSYVNETQSLLNSIRMETAVSNLSKIDIPKCDIPKIDIDIPKINLGLDTSSPNEDTETNESEDDNNAEKH